MNKTVASIFLTSSFALVCGCSSPSEESNRQETALSKAGKFEESGPKIYDGPFGLKMGQSMNELSIEAPEGADPTQAQLLQSVPKPMSDIETYAVVGYQNTGICEIRAVSKSFDSDSYAYNVKPAIDRLAEALTSKYGKSRKSDFCSDNFCQFFQMGLGNGSSGYGYEWSKKTGATLPADVDRINITAMAGEYNDTFYRLDYMSSKTAECKSASTKAKSSAL